MTSSLPGALRRRHPQMPPSYLRWVERQAAALAPVAGPFLQALSEVAHALLQANDQLRPVQHHTPEDEDDA
jgi:hypothetical protein